MTALVLHARPAPGRRPRYALSVALISAWTIFMAATVPSYAQAQPNVATDWAGIVQTVIHNAGAPRSAGASEILHATVMIAMYDAAVAVKGDYQPYASAGIQAPRGADMASAIATAAYRTARARIAPSQVPALDQHYTSYMAMIPNGRKKNDGVAVGELVAAAVLAARADDGFNNVVTYECSAVPPAIGEFEPDAGCPSGPGTPQPVDVKLGQVKPFTFSDPARFRPDGPDPLTAPAYAEDFIETRDYGRIDSLVRTAKQTDIAYFWSENPYVHWNRNLIDIALAKNLTPFDSARFLALVHTSAADAVIAGFEAKYHYRAWRPRTAIPLGDMDDNPDTIGDPSWTPLLSVNHPEYPSGHGFWSGAVIDAMANFFGTPRVPLTLTTSKTAVPRLQQAKRNYPDLEALEREITNSRIWAGLHWRLAMTHGEQVGSRVAAHVARYYFRRVK